MTAAARNLPQRELVDLDAERRTLGALLEAGTDRGVVGAVLGAVRDEDFGEPAHRTVARAIRRLVRREAPVDVATVAQALEDSGALAAAGGRARLVGFAELGVGAVRSGPHHAARVAELARRRALRATALEVAREAGERLDDPGHAAALAGRLLRAETAPQDVEVLAGDEWALRAWNALEGRRDAEAEPGVPCGLRYFDSAGGLERREVVVLAGRPGDGKTALGLRVALGAAAVGAAALVVSLEMSGEDLALRAFAGRGRVAGERVRNPKRLTADELQRLARAIHGLDAALVNLRVTAPESLTTEALRALVMREHAIRPVDLLVLDYAQLVRPSGRMRTREEEVAEASRTLKALAKSTGAAVLALAQMNRAVDQRGEGAEPKLSDLRDSGQIEQDAATVLILSRFEPQASGPPEELTDRRLVYVLKKRHGRAHQRFGLAFDAEHGPWFEDLDSPGRTGGAP